MDYNKIFSSITSQNVFHRQLDTSFSVFNTITNRHNLFEIKSIPAKATLYFTADDYAKIYINGNLVGQGPTPGYTFHYFYYSIDITDSLNEGRNIIAIHAYYQGMINRVWVSGDNRHGIICDIVDENDNILFCTDESTLCHRHTGYSDAGKCGYGTQFLEAYDAGATEVAATLRSPEKRHKL